MLSAGCVLPAGTPGRAALQDAAHLPGGPRGASESLEGAKP